MAPKQRVPASTGTDTGATAATPSPRKSPSNATAHDILTSTWTKYTHKTPQRTKLLDTFMAFLIAVGALQFLYVVVVGNFPFNAFLAGFAATVGQFVLTASLRMQTNTDNKAEFKNISHERAFADFVFGSLLLHFFCVNFIN